MNDNIPPRPEWMNIPPTPICPDCGAIRDKDGMCPECDPWDEFDQ